MLPKRGEIVKKIFSQFPPSHAIPRANEALAIREFKFMSPVLDVGCGDGRFAALTFGKNIIDCGLDGSKRFVAMAKKSGAYQTVVVSEISNMPFFSSTFETVLANSVMEHVHELDLALEEIARILKKQGKFILTVPTPLVSKYLFWSKFIPGYAKFKEKLWHHYNYFGEKVWSKKLENKGFKVESIKKTNGKDAIRLSDIFFPIFPFGPIKNIEKYLRKRNVFEGRGDGATLVILAIKK